MQIIKELVYTPTGKESGSEEVQKPLLASGPIFINPSKVLWANAEARHRDGSICVRVQFLGAEQPTDFIDVDSGAAQAILFAASTEAPNA